MKKDLNTFPTVIIFCGFLFISVAINMLLPARGFSENENRQLAQFPQFTLSSLFSGEFTEDVGEYINDQFYLRDAWIALKAASELALGKTDINGVYIGKDGFLSERFLLDSSGQFEKNAAFVEAFAKDAAIPVYFTLIPGAGEIWADKLPANAPCTNQKTLIDLAAQNSVYARYIDSYSPLYEKRSEGIYFNTDHHWTTLGAHTGYEALAAAMGFKPLEYPEPYMRLEGFYGTASSKCGVRRMQSDTVELAVPPSDAVSVSILDESGWRDGAMYDMSFADKKDKYSVFLGGNFPVLKIENRGVEGPKLLYIKDSFANALLPFLSAHFSEIHVIDLRFCKMSIREYITDENIDVAVISYSVAKFATDKSIYMLNR